MDINAAWHADRLAHRLPIQRSEGSAMAHLVGEWAHRALIKEVELTPKPGLVDRINTGAHRDMNLATFRASAAAIAPWCVRFFLRGLAEHALPAAMFLPALRAEGVACEHDMFAATGGVNTHKGSVFALGLLCAAAGRLFAAGELLTSDGLCAEVAGMCVGLVEQELAQAREAHTAGEVLYQRYGLSGARGEAASGFATARQHGLAPYLAARAAGADEQSALHAALLQLMAYNQDTNLVARGGLAGLAFVQNQARALLAAGGVAAPNYIARVIALDDALIARNLSPGGSADLLAVSWFLSCFST